MKISIKREIKHEIKHEIIIQREKKKSPAKPKHQPSISKTNIVIITEK